MKGLSKFAVGLLAMMVLTTGGMLTGCSQKGATEASKETKGENQTGPEGKKQHKLKILGVDNGNQYIKWAEREQYKTWQVLEEMLAKENIVLDFETVASEQYQVVIQTRIASANNLPDIAKIHTLDNASVMKLAKQGVILPLNDLIGEYSNGNIKHMYEEVYTSAKPLTTTPDGNMYWFSNLHMKTYENTTPAPVGLTVNYRKDWTDKLGIAEPTTIQEFYEMCKTFREKDANGNGAADEILDINISSFGNGIAQCFGLGTSITTYDPVTNTIVSPWLQDGVKEYFQFVQQLVKDGIIDPSLVGGGEMITQRKAENKVGGTYDYGAAGWLAEQVNTEGAYYMPLRPMKALDGVGPRAITEPYDLVWEKFAITKQCKDLEGAIKLFDIVYSDEYATLNNWGIENETFTVEDGVKYMMPDMNDEKYSEKKVCVGKTLWSGLLPRVQLANLEFELPDKTPEQKDYMLDMVTYEPWYPNFNTNYLAMPTDEETEQINKITTNLQTYSTELSIKLALGQQSLDDWDKYMKELEDLGLKTLIQIEQARLDRFLNTK